MSEMHAWAAGFFDGEGHIGIRRVSSRASWTYRLGLSVTQMDDEPLRRLRSMYGGWVNPTNKTGDRSFWIWQVGSDSALAALVSMLPWLTVKRREAELAIEFQSDRHAAHHPQRGNSPVERNEKYRLGILAIRAERKARSVAA